jgi:hypothetical protein
MAARFQNPRKSSSEMPMYGRCRAPVGYNGRDRARSSLVTLIPTLIPILNDEHGTRSLPAMCNFAAETASHHLYAVLKTMLLSAALAE